MITADRVVDTLRRQGFGLFTGVPCSYLTPLIDRVIADPSLRYVGAANEGDAVAIGAGAELGGTPAVVMFQNSGLGNAVSPLTSLTWTFGIPLLLVITWRGEPGGAVDEPQHELMGAITPALLDAMRIPWRPFPASDEALDEAVEGAVRYLQTERTPYAFVLSKGGIAAAAGSNPATGSVRSTAPRLVSSAEVSDCFEQDDVLSIIQRHTETDHDVVIATTGFTGRALEALADRPNQFYMVGSMGCASSVALGLALVQPTRRVVVVDGDGAALMRLGALSTIGHQAPPNLVHIVLDNGVHDSTGSQPTTASSTDLARVADASGYRTVQRASSVADLNRSLAERTEGPLFVHVRTRPRSRRTLPRPAMPPPEVGRRLRSWLTS